MKFSSWSTWLHLQIKHNRCSKNASKILVSFLISVIVRKGGAQLHILVHLFCHKVWKEMMKPIMLWSKTTSKRAQTFPRVFRKKSAKMINYRSYEVFQFVLTIFCLKSKWSIKTKKQLMKIRTTTVFFAISLVIALQHLP